MTRRGRTAPGTNAGSFAPDVRAEADVDLYFHVAPGPAHESITENGIDHARGESTYDHLDFPRGNYLFTDQDAATEYARVREEEERDEYGLEAYDYHVYEVAYEGPVARDPFHDDESGLGESAVYTAEPIPPDRVRLIG